MNKYFDVVNNQEIKNEIRNIGQPRRQFNGKGRFDDKFQVGDQESYDEFKARHKYSRSERKDLIRMVKKIYIQ